MKYEKRKAMDANQPSTWPDIVNPRHRNMKHRCIRIKLSGARCQNPAILGATVCRFHGGASAHVKKAAKARLENAADRLARQLLGMAEDPDMPPAIKLAAIKDALDRAGLNPRGALDIIHELKPWQQVLDGIDRDALDEAPTIIEGSIDDVDVAEFSDGRSA